MLRQVSEIMEGVIKNECCEFTPYFIGQVHDPKLVCATSVSVFKSNNSTANIQFAIFYTADSVTSEKKPAI